VFDWTLMTKILAVLFGLVIGSFLNVVISRLPEQEPFWASRSRCPHCRHILPWEDLIPLLSYLWLRGRCRFCDHPISWRYPAVELATGLLALGLWLRFSGSGLLWVYGPFTAALVVLTVLDLQYFWLPNLITLPGIGLGLAAALIVPQLNFLSALSGALLGAALFQGVRWVYARVTGGERQGMGLGDVKLMAFIGAVLGVEALPWVLLSSAALGSLVGLVVAWRTGQGRLTPIPYGPFLVVGALLSLFWN
jgi:leader peptidase (prepilin peptidase)/N-methyltransferase